MSTDNIPAAPLDRPGKGGRMIAIEKLCYVRLGVADPRQTADFATRIIGLEPVEGPEDNVMFRCDERDHTLVHYRSETPEQAVAIEMRSEATMDAAADRLREAGYAVTSGDAALCQTRRVKALSSFRIRGGVTIELVVRPLHCGWRYFPSRDAGITEFFGVAFASTDVASDIRLWTSIFDGKVTDYVGDAVYIGIDDEHHRIAVHPSATDRLLEVQFRLEGMHALMQNSYFLQSAQVAIAHGPGRRPTSQQVFLTFKGPDPILFGFVAEGDKLPTNGDRLPRQFPPVPGSFCGWGSLSHVPEFCGSNGRSHGTSAP
jgi:2,3-dihydroxy-p-cumate/2,3-dihydroxybenzoate 3,4-dioxygenase